MQDALDQVAKNRTTITIAHRLSTIKKADKILVVSRGRVVEQGTHEGLLAIEDGVYSNLVHAQRLAMDAQDEEELLKVQSADPAIDDALKEEVPAAAKEEEQSYKIRGFLRSFGLLLVEQKPHLVWLLLAVAAAIGSASAFPVQSFLFAKIVTVFQEFGQMLVDDTTHWALMFVALASCLFVTYFVLGWASNSISTHVACTYRQEYFESMTEKPIEFFDADENSSGTLVSRVANDPTQIQEMMGTNMAMVLVAGFSITACVIIAYVFGWKLALVSSLPALPIITAGRYMCFDILHSVKFADDGCD